MGSSSLLGVDSSNDLSSVFDRLLGVETVDMTSPSAHLAIDIDIDIAEDCVAKRRPRRKHVRSLLSSETFFPSKVSDKCSIVAP